MSLAVFLSKYCLLAHSCLNLLVHIGISKTEKQTVGKGFPHPTHFSDDSLIVVSVIETFYMLNLLFVGGIAIGRKMSDIRIHIIIIVGIVLKCINLIHQSASESLSEIDIRLMRIKRTIRIRSIQKPFSLLLIRYNIDDAS